MRLDRGNGLTASPRPPDLLALTGVDVRRSDLFLHGRKLIALLGLQWTWQLRRMGRSHAPARASDVPEDPRKGLTLVARWERTLAGVAAVVLMTLLYELIVTLRAPILNPEIIDISY